MELAEKKLRQINSYSGIIVDVTVDQAQLPNGRVALREVVHHPGGVTILPLDDEGCVYCVRQFRYPYGEILLEVPAGKLERGEDPFECARRELSEETGFTADNWQSLGCLYTSPGYSGETLYLYLARGLRAGEAHPDEGEFLSVERIPLAQLLEQVMDGRIRDAKTVAAVLKTAYFLKKES
ncbi:MAG: NUDIX hydrolase [Oscillospiraceae bacterium]|nr:NUDIX hydrolase [Oscillospiraceae bacterium]